MQLQQRAGIDKRHYNGAQAEPSEASLDVKRTNIIRIEINGNTLDKNLKVIKSRMLGRPVRVWE